MDYRRVLTNDCLKHFDISIFVTQILKLEKINCILWLMFSFENDEMIFLVNL